jgi:glyoxylase-like metal-dependent hydrolase (beta-lactamase superfamily II)
MTKTYRVGRYTYSGPGTVNTWWIEQNDSIVVIDVQRDLQHARAARDKIWALNKPVQAVLITHGHPDHYAGLEVFRATWPGVDIYASPATYREMQTDPHGYMPFVHKLEGADAPRIVPLPNRLFDDGAELRFGELAIHTRELGPGHSDSATAFYLSRTSEMFAGDIVCYKCHLFYLEGGSRIQLRTLERLPSLYPAGTTVHPGHGESSTLAEATEDQVSYTRTVRAMVSAALETRAELTATKTKDVADRIRARYPERLFPAGQPNLLELNVAALAKDLTEERVAFVPQRLGR